MCVAIDFNMCWF